MIKFLKLFCVFNGTVSSGTNLIASLSDPNIVNYTITDKMIKYIKYNDFDAWASIPWTSAYFDVDQPDLKLVKGTFVGNQYRYILDYYSNVAGVPPTNVRIGTGVYTFNDVQLNAFSRILFNHNYVAPDKANFLHFSTSASHPPQFQTALQFEILKPLSFYIKSFMFYFKYAGFSTFTGAFTYSFLDYKEEIQYVFKGQVSNSVYNQDLYNFVTMPALVPNLKYLTVTFDFHGASNSDFTAIDFGQLNIFSKEDVIPVPPNSPFNPEYERAPWYDIFAQLRNAFRWLMFGVVGSVLPVEPLRQFFATIDSLLRRIFDDTISSALQVDFVTGIENVIPLWLFMRGLRFIIG